MHTTPAPNALKRKRGLEEIFDPSKKVAVEGAREASIPAVIQKNKTDSPLLRLPDEILKEIITFVVGGHTLHVKYGEHQPSPSSKSVFRGLRHGICTAQQSEEVAYKDSKYGCADIPYGQHPEFYVQPYSIRHDPCFKSFVAHYKSRLSIAVLYVSRLVYETADHVLLSTNTFAFTDPPSLAVFMGALHPQRIATVNKLQLALPWGVGSSHGDRNDGAPWTDTLAPNIMGALTGLKTLEITLEPRCCSEPYLHPQNIRRRSFRRLRPRSARVMVSDNQNTVLRRIYRAGGSERDRRLTWVQKREVACFYETCLVADSPLQNIPDEALVAKWQGEWEAEQQGRDRKAKTNEKESEQINKEAAAAASDRE
ncbi:MAG: hypothetical protein Q9184_004130 [Pyrenodesmia sp. 2 TL-2023]